MMEFSVEDARAAGSPAFLFESRICEGVQGKVIASPHIHNYVEMLYCQAGVCRVDLNDAVHYIYEGDLIVINSKASHKITAVAEGMSRYVVVKFKPELMYTVEQAVTEFQYVSPFLKHSPSHEVVIRKEALEGSGVPRYVLEIYREFIGRAYGYEISIRSSLFGLLTWIVRYWHSTCPDTHVRFDMSAETYELLDRIFKYVDQNYSEAIGVADMAQVCGMSKNTFSRFFQRHVKRSFMSYLNAVRIQAAEHLLIFTRKSVTDIACDVGFFTSSYFIQRFKACNGITPLTFRKRFLTHNGEADDETAGLTYHPRADRAVNSTVALSLLSDVAPKLN